MLVAILRGLFGIGTLTALLWLISRNRSAISWSLVGKGLAFQIAIAWVILKVPFVAALFEMMSRAFVRVIAFSQSGVDFLFRSMHTGSVDPALVNFAFNILPTIIFFSALTTILYYLGVLQRIVWVFAWIMRKTLKIGGAESLSAVGNIFLGQTEAPLLVKPYIERMSRSELLCLMTGGMATIAGGVLTAYIIYLGGDDPTARLYFAKHLLIASVMSAPAAVVAAKVLMPETLTADHTLIVHSEQVGSNLLDAIHKGTMDGLRLAVNVGAMLLVFTSLIYLLNYLMMNLIGQPLGLNKIIANHTDYDGLSFQLLFGYVFAPIAWLCGISADDMVRVGQLLGEKTILNEFFAYKSLGELKAAGAIAHDKSIIMTTYMLCGFSNIASIGIQIGGIGSLAPGRRKEISELAILSLIGGTIACLYTAAVIGMFYE